MVLTAVTPHWTSSQNNNTRLKHDYLNNSNDRALEEMNMGLREDSANVAREPVGLFIEGGRP